MGNKYLLDDLIGDQSGFLTVIDQKPGYLYDDKISRVVCKCICGNIKEIRRCNFISGNTKSCGCRGRDIKNLIKENAIIKNLKIIKHIKVENEKDKRYLCQCIICGKKYVIRKSKLIKDTINICDCTDLLKNKININTRIGNIRVIDNLDDDLYKCICTKCGRILYFNKITLLRREATCICTRKSKYNIEPGDEFGNFTIIKELPAEKYGRYKLLVLCKCGNTEILNKYDLLYHLRTHCNKCK